MPNESSHLISDYEDSSSNDEGDTESAFEFKGNNLLNVDLYLLYLYNSFQYEVNNNCYLYITCIS